MGLDSSAELWLHLLLVPELKKVHWFRLHQELGSPDAILGASVSRLCAIAQISQETAQAILRGPEAETLAREKDAIAETGAELIPFDHPRYPENLRRSSAPPPALYLLGDLRPDDRQAVVVVGSRQMTQYGKMACQNIVAELAGSGLTIISGMAYGIDSIAHESALRNGGRTVAVLAQGLAVRETTQRQEMRRRIISQGAVLSEFPMTAAAERYYFPTRNHTMAALGLATVVIEAGEKSGALITAEAALDENRHVFAVPGDITREMSGGTNNLIRAGATLIRNGRDVLEELKDQLGAILRETSSVGVARGSAPADSPLDPTARAVLERIRFEPLHFDLLHEQLADSGIGFGPLSAALLDLEMKGLIRHLPGNLYVAGTE
ncbi:MAG: DNA-processing protein DprA [Candidatus Sumerlaeia bacterium]|nr:DNA-processing protein DprA [Candidatus Sumerlaeia bacterium]